VRTNLRRLPVAADLVAWYWTMRPKRQTSPAPTVLMANDRVVVQWCWASRDAVTFVDTSVSSGYDGFTSPTGGEE